jgi:hypothetical protein
MSFVRPEAMDALRRWREVLVGVIAIVIGLWWVFGPGRLLTMPGAALIAAGVALLWVGVQRGRFRSSGGGAGAVQVDEGQVTYFGPLTGGAIALRELQTLILRKSLRPDHWQLDQPGHPPLLIPVNAAGADTLFDAFATLPGLRTERMLEAMRTQSAADIVIWEKDPSIRAQIALH